MLRLLSYAMMLMLTASANLMAMNLGLRFQSHGYPIEQRTSLSVGDTYYKFNDEFCLGFDFDFYSATMFGNIASINTDDGNRISILCSYNSNADSYRLGMVVNDKQLILHDSPITYSDSLYLHNAAFLLDKQHNKAQLNLDGSVIEAPVDLSKTKSATFKFGINLELKRHDIAPIELEDVTVMVDGKKASFWNFTYHNGPDTAVDSISGIIATAQNPHWLIDDHTLWRTIYSEEFKDNTQTAFDPRREMFYIVSDSNVLTFSPLTGEKGSIPVKSGKRPMVFSNHLTYDTISNSLINYNLTEKKVARFDMKSQSWDYSSDDEDVEANYSNHAFVIDGKYAYAFGGYGFYRFHNDLFKIDLTSGSIQECKLSPAMTPLTSAALGIHNGKLYIFGGRGNETGQQELASAYDYSLYEYDLATWEGKRLWHIDSVPKDFLPSQTMYYDDTDDCFYLATTTHGGDLVKIPRTRPELIKLSGNIYSKMYAFDFVFDLFRSSDSKRFYLVFDRRQDPVTHEYAIYEISSPFVADAVAKLYPEEPENEVSDEKSAVNWAVILIILLCMAGGIIVYVNLRRRKVNTPVLPTDDSVPNTSEVIEESVPQSPTEEEPDYQFMVLDKPKTEICRFDRSHSSISMLGGFCVRDKEGNDITSKFTSRLKNLLIFLLLSCEENSAGIKYQIIDSEIWNDKDEKAAKNNRNVSMRKLRFLLEEVGNISITFDRGFFKIDIGDVFFDYREIIKRISDIKHSQNVSPELVNEILELLLMGPLVPNTTYEWLDRYKGDYSDQALTLLGKLLKHEYGKNDDLAYRIAETNSKHELLSEEAMIAKCHILSKRKMIRMAQTVYNKFCREYRHSLGEDYPLSFVDVCKRDI